MVHEYMPKMFGDPHKSNKMKLSPLFVTARSSIILTISASAYFRPLLGPTIACNLVLTGLLKNIFNRDG